MNAPENFEEGESGFGAALASALQGELKCLQEARRILKVALKRAAAVPRQAPSLRVQAASTLASRVVNDARVIAIAIEHGYLQQAATIGAGMADAAFTMAVIAGDEAAGKRFIEHEELERSSVKSVVKAIAQTCRATVATAQVADATYHFERAYRTLSAIKHANGRFLRSLGIREDDPGKVRIVVGPNASERTQSVGSFALLLTSQILLLCTAAFIRELLPQEEELWPEWVRCSKTVDDSLSALRAGLQLPPEALIRVTLPKPKGGN